MNVMIWKHVCNGQCVDDFIEHDWLSGCFVDKQVSSVSECFDGFTEWENTPNDGIAVEFNRLLCIVCDVDDKTSVFYSDRA